MINGFRETVRECNSIDLLLSGCQFTWAKSSGTPNAVEERLDRAMVSETWLNLFLNAQLRNLLAPMFDHSPLLLCIEECPKQHNKKGFHFENSWLEELGVDDVVQSSWEDGIHEDINSKPQCCNKELESWSEKIHATAVERPKLVRR